MQLFTMPVELGQEFRKVTIINFRDIVFEINKGKVALNDHKNKDKVAHKSKQISHFDKDLETILINFKKRLESHIIGANGDGIAELTDSRVSRDGKRFNIFNDRIDYEFQQTEKLFEQKYKEVYGLATRLRNVMTLVLIQQEKKIVQKPLKKRSKTVAIMYI
ncbi:pre-neck appendage protein [Staphylococcus phage S-CoN_Ph27]|nr:pre-neck appendage protein [Staphylococcus phage S-CoN_Ph27]